MPDRSHCIFVIDRSLSCTLCFLLFISNCLAPTCLAGGGPENVFLLINPTSQDSLTVANHYIDLRKIPTSNVFYLSYYGGKSRMESDKFREKILRPTIKEINGRKLGDQIDYVVYSCDYPFRVRLGQDFPELKLSNSFKPVASLTGATYLMSFVNSNRKEIFSPVTNFYSVSDPKNKLTISRAFRAQHHWAMGGKRVAKGRGIGYMLSAILGVTFGRGNSSKEIANYLRRAKEADGTKPKGTVYFVKNDTPRSTPRHDRFPAAVRELSLAGVNAEIHEGVFLQNKGDIIGLTCGHQQLGVAQSGCRFSPGALCDNLTSAGGQFDFPKKPPGQTCVSEFLRHGAAGACGTVVEPTAMAQKFPMPSMHVHYAKGCSLAESFYQSVLSPYQQLLVGDPLCQPWADSPVIEVQGVTDNDRIRDTVTLTPTAKMKAGKKVGLFELYVDGVLNENCKPGGEFSLDSTTLVDGYHELRVVGTDDTPIEIQGRWIANVFVKNGTEALQLSVDISSVRPNAEQITVNVAATIKGLVVVKHNGREVGRHPKGTGEIQIVAKKLGKGPITLSAHSIGKVKLRSKPVRFEIP